MDVFTEKKIKKGFKGKDTSHKQDIYTFENMDISKSEESIQSLDDSIVSSNNNGS